MSKETINVGVYNFPPFVVMNKGVAKGKTIDIINFLNIIQDKYIFKVFKTSSIRRFSDFQNSLYDIIMFENKKWGWNHYNISKSKVFHEGKEVFISLKKTGRTQDYFNDLKYKSLVGILGYHYKFNNFISDKKDLKKKFNITLVTKHSKSIEMILKDRADIAIITKSYLDNFMKNNKRKFSKLLISKKLDQEYKHTVLMKSDNKKISISIMNSLLDKVIKSGILTR